MGHVVYTKWRQTYIVHTSLSNIGLTLVGADRHEIGSERVSRTGRMAEVW